MKPLSVRQIRKIVAGELIHGSDDTIIHYGAYRPKQIKKNNTIFFSKTIVIDWEKLKGFSSIALVIDRDLPENKLLKNVTIIKVADTEKAYWTFVNYYRNLFDIPVAAVTGTSGKTTVKEMIKHILSADRTVAATTSSNNSRTAHLQYLLSIDESTEAAVFETAVGAPGDIIKAARYFKPTIGIITNIGAHHLNYCKTPEVYISAKGEMAEVLSDNGVLIINSDDKNSRKLDLSNCKGRIIKVGKNSSCHFRVSDIQYEKNGMKFNVLHSSKKYPMFVPGLGEHQVYNALAAIAAVHEMGMDLPEAAKRLKTFQNLNKHLEVYEGLNSCTILDDTWSMTSTSLEAALNVLRDIGKTKKTVAILGGMTDLGAWGYVIHEQAGETISRVGVDILITIGDLARRMADHAVKNGLKAQVHSFNSTILVYELLKKIVNKDTVVLIKGDMYSQQIMELAAKLRKKE